MAPPALGTTSESKKAAQIELLAGNLYEAVQQNGSETRAFTQNDLLDLDVIPGDDVALLLTVVQELCNTKFFIGIQDKGNLFWRWRSRHNVEKYKSFPDPETTLVYEYIDEAGADGIWSRTIKNRCKMHDTVLKTCLKWLEMHGHITDMKSVEHPNKKMYIRADLRPSERATGGPWFSEGELDSAFVGVLLSTVFDYIRNLSAYLSNHARPAPRLPKKGAVRGGDPEGSAVAGKKRPATDMSNDGSAATTTAAAAAATAPSARHKKAYLPLPAGYTAYPTVPEIAKFIHESNITVNTTLSEDDVQQLVDLLVFDGVVEPIKIAGRRGYRVTRVTKQDPTSQAQRGRRERDAGGPDGAGAAAEMQIGPDRVQNGLTEAPCGRCPVFDLCEDGGPVSASNCVYFQRWLGLD